MDSIRTTITLPIELHERLRLLSVKEKRSLGELISDKFGQRKSGKKTVSVELEIKKSFTLFDKVAKSSVSFDAAKAVREERDRDHA